MSAPRLGEAHGESLNKAFSRALGDELRRVREAEGWSRVQLVERLPSGICDRTLLSYEHGTRHLTALRLVELCFSLQVDAPTLLGRALQRARIHIEHLPLKVDLRSLLKDETPTYRPLAQWAKNALNEHPNGIAEITPETVKNLALFMGCTSDQLARYLARFLPDD